MVPKQWLLVAVLGIFLAGAIGVVAYVVLVPAYADVWKLKVKCKGAWRVSVDLTRDFTTVNPGGLPTVIRCNNEKKKVTITTTDVVNDIQITAAKTTSTPKASCSLKRDSDSDLKQAKLKCSAKVKPDGGGEEKAKVEVKAEKQK